MRQSRPQEATAPAGRCRGAPAIRTLVEASSSASIDEALVLEVLADTGHADFAVREVRAAIAADRKVRGGLPCGDDDSWARP